MLYDLFRPILIVLFKIFFRIDVFGKGHIPKKGGFILASNHLSNLDPVVLGVACPRKLNFMAKRELFKTPLLYRFLHSVGAFPVERDSADLRAMREAMRRVKKGKALVLFPEGSRKVDSNPGQVQAGVGFLASKLGVPVVPAFIKGTEIALPKHAKFIRFTKIVVRFGKQISFERRLPYQDIALRIMEDIRQLSDASD